MAAHHGANEGPNRLTEEACHACAQWRMYTPGHCAMARGSAQKIAEEVQKIIEEE